MFYDPILNGVLFMQSLKRGVHLKTIKRVFLIFGILIISAAVINMIVTSINAGNLLILMFGGIFSIFGSIWSKMPNNLPAKAFKGIIIFIIVFFAVMILFIIVKANPDSPDFTEDSVIVLGCGLKKDMPSRTLYKRLDKAIEYYEKNKNAVIVVTGGQGKNELRPEAEAMAEYLIEKGVDENKILKEDKAASTSENFRFSKDILDDYFERDYTCVCITSNFHSYRASRLAKIAGIDVKSFSSPTPASYAAVCYLREALAVIQLWIFKK